MYETMKTPGDYIREEIDARGWTQADLARILGRPLPTVNEIIVGKRAVMPEMAVGLAIAFGQTPELWMQREADFRLSLVKDDGGEIDKRRRLYELAPIKDMEKRGWIKRTGTIEQLEDELRRFFGQDDLAVPPSLSVSTRRTENEIELTALQRAWCFRARNLAAEQVTKAFDESKLDACAAKLRKLAAFAPEARKIGSVFADFGIRFVVVEPLPGAKIDGAALWVDDQPVVAVSIRHDRIDAFWFTVFHELSHIRNHDSLSLDTELVGEDAAPSIGKSAVERRADAEAASMLIPNEAMESFIKRVSPLYSKARIIQFAHRIKLHPGIIVGQLQHRGEIGFYAVRDLLVKIRESVVLGATVDGWGHLTA